MNYQEAMIHAWETYPEAEAQDFAKLTCQITLGPGHLIRDPESAVKAVLAEKKTAGTSEHTEALEPIGDGFFRAHLQSPLSPRAVACMFLYSAATAVPYESARKNLAERVQTLRRLCRESILPPMWESWLTAWQTAGMPLQHHSVRYREAYRPAYRVLSETAVTFSAALEALEKKLAAADEQHPLLVAIDGNCAGGKTSLGKALAAAYGGTLFHMDDFFLRPEQRTAERLAEPGGNVDYERFQREILEPLRTGKAFSYRKFNCQTKALGETVAVTPGRLYIMEGSYSLHPFFGKPYGLRLFMRCTPQEQMRRILQRNGEKMAERFRREWIPMEERYFSTFAIEQEADFLLRS